MASRDSELTKIRGMMSSDEAKWMEWNAKVAMILKLTTGIIGNLTTFVVILTYGEATHTCT